MPVSNSRLQQEIQQDGVRKSLALTGYDIKTPVKAVHLPKLPTVDDHEKIRIGMINNSDYSVNETAAPVRLPLLVGDSKQEELKIEANITDSRFSE